jgi:hypothetical protein
MSSRTPTPSATPNLDASLEQVHEIADDAIGRLQDVATTAADVLAEKAPAASTLSQQAVAAVGERLDKSPEDALLIAAALTGGIWIGMALSRAPRWMLLLAVVPTLVLVLAALPRFATRKPTRR